MATSLAAVIALGITGPGVQPHVPLVSLALLEAIWLISAAVFDCYDSRVAARVQDSVLATARALFATSFVYFTIQLAIPELIPPLGRNLFAAAIWFTVAMVAISLGRMAYIRLFAQVSARRRIAIMAAADSIAAAEGLLRAIEIDYEVVGLIARNGLAHAQSMLPVLGPHTNLAALVSEHRIDEVIVAEAGDDPAAMDALIDAYESGVVVRHFSDIFEEVTGRIPVRYLRPHWFAVLPRRPGGGRLYTNIRRAIDILVAGTALLVLLPLLAIVALAIRLDSPGPVIFRQERQGYRGLCFTILKFRTMRDDAERDGPRWAEQGDPRRTRLGKILRPTRIDELPQLWNVLVGDMSLIGPRPERPCFVAELGRAIPFYRARSLVRPGITGWAQVRFAYAGSTEDTLEKLQYDLFYVKHRSPFLDLVIAFKTLGVLFHASGR